MSTSEKNSTLEEFKEAKPISARHIKKQNNQFQVFQLDFKSFNHIKSPECMHFYRKHKTPTHNYFSH